MKHNHAFSHLVKALLLTGILGAMLTAFLFVPASVSAAAVVPGAALHTQPHQAGTFIHLATSARTPAALPLALDPPTCSGTGCNGLNPYSTYCAGQSWDNWWVVTSRSIYYGGRYVGYIQLWWSQTCQTNWGRLVPAVPSTHPAVNTLLDDGNSGYYGTYTHYVAGTVGAQLYAPVALASTEGCFLFSGHKVLGTTGQFAFPNPGCYYAPPA